jgi:hypothetical protein
MIKKFIEFIKENSEVKGENNFNSLGEWVEYLFDLYKSDEEKISNLKSIINKEYNIRYEDDLNDIKSDIRLANAINILDDKTKSEMSSLISNFVKNGSEEREPIVDFSTDVEDLNESDITMSGKNIFKSFLKTITALGKKDQKPNREICPDDFLFYYNYDNIISEDLKQILKRFKSLHIYSDLIPYDSNESSLYYGVKTDGQLEYGLKTDKIIPIGLFKIGASSIKWLLGLDLKSLQFLKNDIVNWNSSELSTLSKIKLDLITYNPGFFDKKSHFIITDKVITIGYYGIGKWDNGKIDIGEFQNLKQNFNNWIINKKWHDKIKYNITSNSFWVYFNIKIK